MREIHDKKITVIVIKIGNRKEGNLLLDYLFYF